MQQTQPSAESSPGARFCGVCRIRSRIIALVLVLGVAATYYAACSLLIHYSFHSFGWDLGLFDQLLWNLSRGNGWEYSFREMSYLGDHFQPLLLVLVPLVSLDMGPVPLLVVQAIALAAAAIPLFASVRALSGERAAWLLAATYLLSLPVLDEQGHLVGVITADDIISLLRSKL